MKKRLRMAVGAIVALALVATGDVAAAADKKPKKPELKLRVRPRFGFSPLNVFVTAELKGGDDVEEYYCPELEWEWGDGGKSIHEADCDPWEEGVTELQRRFSASHLFKYSGVYRISLRLKRLNKTIARTIIKLTVRQGAGEVRD